MKEHTLTLQVLSNKVQQIPTSIVQNDSDTNVILISLVDATNKPYSLGTITSIGCKVLKENGNIAILGTSNVITTDWANGKIKVTLPSLAVSQAGVCQAVIEFYDTGRRVTTARFSYLVTADIMGSANQQIDVDTAIQLTTLTQNAMGQFESFKTTAQAAEIMRVNNESTRVSNENTRVANESSRSSSESTRVSNESTRTANESTRVSNEIARVNSESARANAENTRISAESTRRANEDARVVAETTRSANELDRVSSESTRANNENARIETELTRTQNESSRLLEESKRATSEYSRSQEELTRQGKEAERLAEETQRVARENARVANESDRVLSEDNRKENESARVTAENNRVNTEATRVSNENSRTAAETTRASNEATRISAESARVTSETARISNENARVISETARINAESTRSTNETGRVSSETTRASNEAARVNAEAGRVTTFNAQVATIAEKTTTSINGEQSNVNFIEDTGGNICQIEVDGQFKNLSDKTLNDVVTNAIETGNKNLKPLMFTNKPTEKTLYVDLINGQTSSKPLEQHGAIKITFNVSSFYSETGDIIISYNFIPMSAIITSLITKVRCVGGTISESNNITGFSTYDTVKGDLTVSKTITNNTLEVFIYPLISVGSTPLEYLVKNLKVTVLGNEVTPVSINTFQSVGTITSNKLIDEQNLDTENEKLGYIKSDVALNNPFHNKTLLVIGDSISDNNLNQYCSTYYYDYLKNIDGLNYIMDGRSGTGYVRAYDGNLNIPNRIDLYDGYNPDYISIFAGTNDWFQGNIPLGVKGDTTMSTFYGALKITYDKLINKYPLAKVLIATPIRRAYETSPNSFGSTLKDYRNAIIEMASDYSFTIIDLYAEGGINPLISISRSTYFKKVDGTLDGTHPNDAGQLRLYPKFREGLLRS